jgi:hypothetical protein
MNLAEFLAYIFVSGFGSSVLLGNSCEYLAWRTISEANDKNGETNWEISSAIFRSHLLNIAEDLPKRRKEKRVSLGEINAS